MKNIKYTLLLLTLIQFNLNGQINELHIDKTYNIKYLNEINGYTINALWIPTSNYSEHILGAVIINFYNKKDSTSFYLTNNNFSILKSKLPILYSVDSSSIIGIGNSNQDSIFLDYNENKLTSTDVDGFGTTNEPFFFHDIDFDNRKELIIAEVGQGQRGIATFKSYNLGGDELYKINNNAPLNNLDELTSFDITKKEITLWLSGGACASEFWTYKLMKSENDGYEFVLKSKIKYKESEVNGNTKCYELKYNELHSSQLTSKKEMKQ